MHQINLLVTIAGLDINSGGPARSVTSLTSSMISENLQATIFTSAKFQKDIIEFDKKNGLSLDVFLQNRSSDFLFYKFDDLYQ